MLHVINFIRKVSIFVAPATAFYNNSYFKYPNICVYLYQAGAPPFSLSESRCRYTMTAKETQIFIGILPSFKIMSHWAAVALFASQ